MLSGACFFRGHYGNAFAVNSLVENLCLFSDLVPEHWNTFEPIDKRFSLADRQAIASAIAAEVKDTDRCVAFFARQESPGYLLSMDLRSRPFQWTSAHSSISLRFPNGWSGGEEALTNYLATCSLPNLPDYASVPDWRQEKNRYSDLRRSLSGSEVSALLLRPRPILLPFGPFGCLADIHWYNFFGKEFVNLIGRSRLLSAGWARTEEIGDSIGCFAANSIDQLDLRQRCDSIAQSLNEFVWSPGSCAEDKVVPDFTLS